MKILFFLGLLLVLVSLAEATRDATRHSVDGDGLVEPSRTLMKRRKGGGAGGFGGDDEEDEGEPDGDGSRCLPEPILAPSDPDHYNPLGYGAYEEEGRGSKSNVQGGYTKNGTGSYPSWTLDDGSWTYDYYPDGKPDPSTRYYFGGALVPYEAYQDTPNGIGPWLTHIDFGERRIVDWPRTSEDSPAYVYDCQMPKGLVVYSYPVAYTYVVMDMARNPDYGYLEYVPVGTKEIKVLCVCNPNTVCGCDYPGDPEFVQALGNHTLNDDEHHELMNKNSTHACYLPYLNGTTPTLLVNGTLKIGSTKADPSMPDMPMVTQIYDPCPPGDSGGSLNWEGLSWAVMLGGMAVSTTAHLTVFSF